MNCSRKISKNIDFPPQIMAKFYFRKLSVKFTLLYYPTKTTTTIWPLIITKLKMYLLSKLGAHQLPVCCGWSLQRIRPEWLNRQQLQTTMQSPAQRAVWPVSSLKWCPPRHRPSSAGRRIPFRRRMRPGVTPLWLSKPGVEESPVEDSAARSVATKCLGPPESWNCSHCERLGHEIPSPVLSRVTTRLVWEEKNFMAYCGGVPASECRASVTDVRQYHSVLQSG